MNPDGDILAVTTVPGIPSSENDCCKWNKVLFLIAIAILVLSGVTAVVYSTNPMVRIIGIPLILSGLVALLGLRSNVGVAMKKNSTPPT